MKCTKRPFAARGQLSLQKGQGVVPFAESTLNALMFNARLFQRLIRLTL